MAAQTQHQQEGGACASSPHHLHVVVFPWLAFGHMIPFLELTKRLARRGHAVTFVSTPRNAARLGAVPPELSARLRVVALDLPDVDGLPDGAESTADVPPDKVGLLKKAFDGLAAPFADLVVALASCAETNAAAAGSGNGDADGDGFGFSRKPDFIVLDFAQNWIWPIAEQHEMISSYRKLFWGKRGRPAELYPDVSSKDAAVPPDLPVPNYDCERPACVSQSRHPDTAACCFYECSTLNEYERCFFFQRIDSPDKFDPKYLLFKDPWRSRHAREHFKRWVPPPPNPPPMTKEEQDLAAAIRMETPSLCHCGDQAVVNERDEFECPNKVKNHPLFQKCRFKEWLWGPKSFWPEEAKEDSNEKKEEVITIKDEPTLCKCGVEAHYGLVPLELGIGYWCGHMVDYDESTRKCNWVCYEGATLVRDTIKQKQSLGRHLGCGNQLVDNYIEMRKRDMQRRAEQRGLMTPLSVQWKKWNEATKKRQDVQRAMLADAKELQYIKELEAQLCLKVGCTGDWFADEARSRYIQMKVEKAEKKAETQLNELISQAEAQLKEQANDDDTSKLDELISLAMAQLKEQAEDEFLSQAADKVEAAYYQRKAKGSHQFEKVEEEEWYSQVVDAAEDAYMTQKAVEAQPAHTSRSNEV